MIQDTSLESKILDRFPGLEKMGKALPILRRYDAHSHAVDLLNKDKGLRGAYETAGFKYNEQVEHLARELQISHDDYKGLLTLGKTCDTVDRLTSPIAGVLEVISTWAGGHLTLGAIEEIVECVPKAVYGGAVLKKEGIKELPYLALLAGVEAGTFLIPIAGDVYDMVTNHYMNHATALIASDAKGRAKEELERILSTRAQQILRRGDTTVIEVLPEEITPAPEQI